MKNKDIIKSDTSGQIPSNSFDAVDRSGTGLNETVEDQIGELPLKDGQLVKNGKLATTQSAAILNISQVSPISITSSKESKANKSNHKLGSSGTFGDNRSVTESKILNLVSPQTFRKQTTPFD